MKITNQQAMTRSSQNGIAAVWILVLLIAGVAAGTYLIQSGTNFLPWAAEQEPLHPSAGKTQDCSKLTNETEIQTCKDRNNTICFADTVTYCDNRQGSPRAIRKSGGYWDPSHANQDPQSGCVFDYREVPEKNSECGKTESKNGDVVYTTVDEARRLDKERADSLPSRQSQATSGGPDTSAACIQKAPGQTESTLQVFQDEKVAGNLARFYAILDGVPDLCVPSDLGVAPEETAKTKDGATGRQMLCSGSNGELTWRVIVGNDLKVADKPAPDPEQTRSTYNCSQRLKDARQKAGLPAENLCNN